MDSQDRWGRTFLAVLVFLSILLHALSKTRATIGEMLWACYVASAILAVGLLLNKPRWVAVGFLFEATLGFPAWLMDALATQSTTFTSCFGHLAPMTAGFLYLRRAPLQKGVLLPAWLLYPVMIAVSRWATPPKLNVNLAHAPWAPGKWAESPLWMHWTFNTIAALVLLFLAELLLRRIWRATDAPRSPDA